VDGKLHEAHGVHGIQGRLLVTSRGTKRAFICLAACTALICLQRPSLGGPNGPTPSGAGRNPTLRETRIQKLPASIMALDFAAGPNLAATALTNSHVLVWKLDSGEVVHDFRFPEPVTDPRQKLERDVEPIRVRFSPDGKELGISFLSRIHLYAIGDWHELGSLGVDGEDTIRTRSKPVLARRLPPGQETDKGPGPTLNELVHDWDRLLTQGDGRTRITDFKFCRDGSFILAAYCRGGCYDRDGALRIGAFPSGNDPVRLWNVRSGQLGWERTFDPQFVVERLEISPNDATFAAAEHRPGECRIEVRDLGTGNMLYSLPQVHFAYAVPSLGFAPDGDTLITLQTEGGMPKTLGLAEYQATSGKQIAVFSGRYPTWHADLSPDGGWLVTSGNGVRFRIWDVKTHRVVLTKTPKQWLWSGPPIETVSFSPDGRWLIVASDTSGVVAVYQFRP
jgi:WD40 repeat protein